MFVMLHGKVACVTSVSVKTDITRRHFAVRCEGEARHADVHAFSEANGYRELEFRADGFRRGPDGTKMHCNKLQMSVLLKKDMEDTQNMARVQM